MPLNWLLCILQTIHLPALLLLVITQSNGSARLPLVHQQRQTSSSLNLAAASQLYISPNTTLTIDTNLTLTNCEIVLGSNARIIIADTAELNLVGCYLHSCTEMWDGIYATGDAGITVEHTTIEDALNGIVVSGIQAKMLVSNTHFYRNRYGIRALYTGFDSTLYNVSGCYFSMGYDTMLPVPAGIIPCNKPIAGIELKFCKFSIPNAHYNGIADTFANMNNGILSYWSQTNIYDNYFSNIHNTETNPAQTGAAVYATGNSTWNPNSYLQVITAANKPAIDSAIHFSNCDFGIWANISKLNLANNRMDSVTHCIKTMNSIEKVWAHNNYLTNTNYGITLNNNAAAEQRAWHNTIHVNEPTLATINNPSGPPFNLYANTYGIYQTEINNALPVTSSIDSNQITGGRNCIALNNTNGTQVFGNQLNQTRTTAVAGGQAGIYGSNCLNLKISDNTSLGNGSAYCDELTTGGCYTNNAFRKAGYSFYMSSGEFCSNAADSISYATYFAGDCNDMNIRKNTYGKSKFAMVLRSSGSSNVIGNQGYDTISVAESHENLFNGSGTNHTFDNDSNFRTMSFINIPDTALYFPPAFFYSGAASTSNIQYSDTSGALLNGVYEKFAAIQTIKIDTNSTISPYTCVPVSIPIVKDWDLLIAGGNGENYMEEGYGETGNWLARKKLFNKLRANPSLGSVDTLLTDFYAECQNTSIDKISDYQQKLIELYDSATVADSSLYADTKAEAIDLNGRLTTYTEDYVENFVATNYIYLNRLFAVSDTFSSSDVTNLRTIAEQCPYIAGDAVYIARTLLSQIEDIWFYDDISLCTVGGSYKKENETVGNNQQADTIPLLKEYVKVFPNPANSKLNLLFQAKVMGKAKFELMNLMGQTLKTVNLQDGANYATFEVNDLPNGMYMWRLRDKAKSIGSGTVIIQR